MMKIQSRKIWYYRITLIILVFAMLLAWARLPGVLGVIKRSGAAMACKIINKNETTAASVP